MGKIAQLPRSSERISAAVQARRARGHPGAAKPRVVAAGQGWRILDVLCTCDAHDRVAEERHSHYSLAMVLAGAFRYRSRSGSAFLAPGSILLGRAGAPFQCWHDHGAGDRCLAVQFDAEAFEEFADPRDWPAALSVHRHTVGLFACAELVANSGIGADEGIAIAIAMADRIVRMIGTAPTSRKGVNVSNAARMLELARWIETDPAAELSLPVLARHAGISKFHLVRLFKRVLGVPPHAYIRRARLRNASQELCASNHSIVDVAFRSGFCDVSTFNAAFRRELTGTPGSIRAQYRKDGHRALLQSAAGDSAS